MMALRLRPSRRRERRPLLATPQYDQTLSLKQSRQSVVMGRDRSPDNHAINRIAIRIAGEPAAAARDARAETHREMTRIGFMVIEIGIAGVEAVVIRRVLQ